MTQENQQPGGGQYRRSARHLAMPGDVREVGARLWGTCRGISQQAGIGFAALRASDLDAV